MNENSPIARSASPALEEILDATLTDWAQLLRSAEALTDTSQYATVPWTQKAVARTSRSLRKGDDFEVRAIAGGLCLHRHPGLMERLFGWAIRGFDLIMAPVRMLRDKLDSMLLSWAKAFGAGFAFVGIPFTLVAMLGDLVALVAGFVRSLPDLILRPVRLVREIVTFPFQVVAAMISRVVRTVLLGFVGKWLDASADVDTSRLKSALTRRPWLRGLILGFLRKGRPEYPVLIDGGAVSQVLVGTRTGLFGKRKFLVVVEGDPIEPRFGRAMRTRLLALLMPFYWTRTVHMFNTSDATHPDLMKLIAEATAVDAQAWN